ncbi:MAG: L,D-transpeptidase [Acidimicrobiales bacterium]
MPTSRFIPPLLAVVLWASACGPTASARPHAGRSASVDVTPTTAHPVAAPPLPPGVTEVAAMDVETPASRVPGGPPVATVPQSWYGFPSVLPIIERQPGWIEVREAQKPNESTAWIPEKDAAIGTTAYRLVLHLATTRLQELRDSRQVADFPAGIGTARTPTPAGHFFVTMKAPAPSAGYGPFVLVTSGHSDTITDWEASGDAITAIHGPIDAASDARIGTTGARVSDGCIRLHDRDLAQLADIPAGTPLDVEA